MDDFWKRWMYAAIGITELTGIAMVLGVVLGAHDALASLFGLVAVSGTSVAFGPAAALGTGIAGALMVGWSVTMFSLMRNAALEPDSWARNAILHGLLAWFVLDGLSSWASGAAWNLIGNGLFLGLFLPPLLSRGERATVAQSSVRPAKPGAASNA